MARYDVFVGPYEGSYLLDVQSDLLDHLKSRVVVPLLPAADVPPPVRRLNPSFEIGDDNVVMATHLVGAVALSELGAKLANLGQHHDQVVAALDMLFQGF
ncbi:CcdB family protein [Aminobacter carboxidus]|uniref:Toxin CcdB n=1 Tax=Aminobacter carboxidus TaxID=376165 RepID=A0ABR9GM49_9HYPH|nr:CcdB family protein [Aminobacter carboxidus]MBE1204760.1 CcdB family protein [Aminobacter carboxidus]